MADRYTPRPTTYCGIKMRSRLEADFARFLDQGGFSWVYEPQCFASPRGQYLPDFLISSCGFPWYVEVKPADLQGGLIEGVLEKLEIIWESEPASLLSLVFWEYQRDSLGDWLGALGEDHWWTYIAADGSVCPWPGRGQFKATVDAAIAGGR